jgi:hypothetical protein
VRLCLSRYLHDRSSRGGDLERDGDRPPKRRVDLNARPARREEGVESDRVLVDQDLRAHAQSLRLAVRDRGASPIRGANRDLLQQGCGRRDDRGRGRATRGCGCAGGNLVPKVSEPQAG